MNGRRTRGLALAVFSLLASCAPASPVDRVAVLRSHYGAQLLGFQVLQPAAAAQPAAQGRAEAKGALVSEGSGLVAPPPATSDVELEIELSNSGPDALSALTLEVSRVSSAQEKQHFRIWVETGGIAPATSGRLKYVLREVPYQTGDLFAVAVRSDVPRSERALYREFPAAP